MLLAINGGRYCEISYKFLFCKSILIKQRNKAHDLENAQIFLRRLKVIFYLIRFHLELKFCINVFSYSNIVIISFKTKEVLEPINLKERYECFFLLKYRSTTFFSCLSKNSYVRFDYFELHSVRLRSRKWIRLCP